MARLGLGMDLCEMRYNIVNSFFETMFSFNRWLGLKFRIIRMFLLFLTLGVFVCKFIDQNLDKSSLANL